MPDGFVNRSKPITIDEAQKCPEIFAAIKRAVDKKRIPGGKMQYQKFTNS
jgi:predicted AAA+ superfamily ATPase